MKLIIDNKDLEESKTTMIDFDKQKTYNKFVCNHNYIGLLGEMTFDKYLTSVKVTHTWVPFMKKSSQEPDFIIKDQSIDLKTTYGDSMWFTVAKYDYYIYCKLSEDNKSLDIQRWISKESLLKAIEAGVAKQIPYKNRKDYCISSKDMATMETFPLI